MTKRSIIAKSVSDPSLNRYGPILDPSPLRRPRNAVSTIGMPGISMAGRAVAIAKMSPGPRYDSPGFSLDPPVSDCSPSMFPRNARRSIFYSVNLLDLPEEHVPAPIENIVVSPTASPAHTSDSRQNSILKTSSRKTSDDKVRRKVKINPLDNFFFFESEFPRIKKNLFARHSIGGQSDSSYTDTDSCVSRRMSDDDDRSVFSNISDQRNEILQEQAGCSTDISFESVSNSGDTLGEGDEDEVEDRLSMIAESVSDKGYTKEDFFQQPKQRLSGEDSSSHSRLYYVFSSCFGYRVRRTI